MNSLRKLFASPKSVTVVRPKTRMAKHGGGRASLVMRNTTPLSVKRGWKKSRNTWTGSYATFKGTWKGRIERRGDVIDVFIKQPPPEVRGHKRFICFHKHKAGWWKIHLHTQPVNANDFDSVIAYVEQLLTQSLKAA